MFRSRKPNAELNILEEFVPSTSAVPGFDPGTWGNIAWDVKKSFVVAVHHVETASEIRELLFWFHILLAAETRCLCCEPCRRSYTNLYWRKREIIQKTLGELSGLFRDVEDGDPIVSQKRYAVQMILFDLIYDLQAMVSSKIAAEHQEPLNERVKNKYPNRASALRRMLVFDDIQNSPAQIHRLLTMMAMQCETEVASKSCWVRYSGFLSYARAVSVALKYIPCKQDLSEAIEKGMGELTEHEGSCCSFTRNHDSINCAKALVWSIGRHAKTIPKGDTPESFFKRIEQARGRSMPWWEEYIETRVFSVQSHESEDSTPPK